MSMKPHALNPDSTIIQQVEGQLDKLFAAVVHKAGGGKPIKITADDLRELSEKFDNFPVLFTHGMSDGIELSVVSAEQAKVIAAHDASLRAKAAENRQ